MKLKEIPVSVYHTLKLKSLKTKELQILRKNHLPVIISLTSIPSRLHKVHITIRSILFQSRQAKKVILWLNENDKNHIPKSLKILCGPTFEIRYTPLTCSHKKLIHTLESFPDDIIVTCDDDFIYNIHWLEKIYNEHSKHPKAIIGNFTRQIQYDAQGNLLDYKKWTHLQPENKKTILAIGAEGILYPPKSLSPIATDIDLALQLAPKADDLWFKAMSLLQGTEVVQAKDKPKGLIPIFGTQKISLKKENIDKNRNLTQWKALTEYFKLDLK
jgi:hypothetical protein